MWHNAPVPSFGPENARLLVVGLAPGRGGANRTGRPFTGDGAGEVLYPALLRHGFARGSYAADPADGLTLVDCRITNSVRCVPPENRPTGAEITACRPFLEAELLAEPRPTVVLALGRIAFDTTVRSLGARPRSARFGHGTSVTLAGICVVASYHTSRYNMNTGRLTTAMFDAVLARIRDLVRSQGALRHA
jgi:uracil-DNA glycosylase family 4